MNGQPELRHPDQNHSGLWQYASVRPLPGRKRLPPSVVDRIQRERLLRAMVAVVAEQGYQACSVKDMLARAGMSSRTFYELFANREECFVAAYEEVAGFALAQVRVAFEAGSSPADRIERALEALLGFWAEHPEEACFCVDEVLGAGSAGRACHTGTVERLASLLGGALAELRGVREPDPLAARAFVGGVFELLRAGVDDDDPAPLPALASRIVAWERRGPAGKPAPGSRRRALERRPIDPADQRWVDRVHPGAGTVLSP
jgi:AcrR family transcriptional regulator